MGKINGKFTRIYRSEGIMVCQGQRLKTSHLIVASSVSVEDDSDSGDSATSDSYTDIRNQKIAKYGKDTVEAIEKEYGDETKA